MDSARYRENCVGFTHGFVDWEEAKKSVRQVWKGLPDLRVELDQILASDDVALAHGTVRGTATGRLYGAPAAKRSCQASFFDYVRIDHGADHRAGPASRRARPDAPALRQGAWPDRARRHVPAAVNTSPHRHAMSSHGPGAGLRRNMSAILRCWLGGWQHRGPGPHRPLDPKRG